LNKYKSVDENVAIR